MEVSSHGWKTYLAAVAAITAGAVALANGDVAHGLQGIVGGVGLIGIRGGIAKIIQVIQAVQR